MRVLLMAGGVALVGLLAALALTRLVENSLIFFPARYPAGEWDPSRLGVRAEEIAFTTSDGLTLYGWWFDAAAPDETIATAEPTGGAEDPASAALVGPVLLWAHGNAGNLIGRAPHAQVLAGAGVSVFVFDYRGYGRSQGRPDEAGIYLDAEAAYAYLVAERGIAPGRIILMGRSLGSAPAARLATRVQHAGTILVSPLPSAKRMARKMFFGMPVDLLGRARFPVVDWVAARATPLLVIHGDRDNVIPIEYGREVFDAAAQPKEWVVLPGAGHNDILQVGGARYVDAVVGFARRAVEAAR